jgi:Ca-activated chloride channel family protein
MTLFSDLGITFERPWLLLLLLVIPILSYLRGHLGGSPAIIFSSTEPLRALGRLAESRAGNFLSCLLFFGLALLIIALAQPRTGKSITRVQASGIDIMMCNDISGSMLAEDYMIGNQRASRVDTIKKVTSEFIEGRPNDRIGLIAFAGRPYLVSPLTLDHDWLLKNLDRVQIGVVEDGTAIGSAIASACNRLKDKKSKSKIIVLLTDGDNNAGRIAPITAAEAAKALGIKVYTIGAGTDGYVPYPAGKDVFGRVVYQQVKFGMDEKDLKEIARITGGHYYRAAETNTLEDVFRQIDQYEKSKAEVTQFRQYRELFPWFLTAGLGVLFLQATLSQTVWRKLP